MLAGMRPASSIPGRDERTFQVSAQEVRRELRIIHGPRMARAKTGRFYS